MSLTARFQFLFGIFGLCVVATVLISLWGVNIYVAQASEWFALATPPMREAARIRGLLDELTTELRSKAARDPKPRDDHYRRLYRRIMAQIAGLDVLPEDQDAGAFKEELETAAAKLAHACEEYVHFLEAGSRKEAAALLESDIAEATVRPMLGLLDTLARTSDSALVDTSRDVGNKEALVTAILSINALAVLLMVFVGMRLVRNWVLRPVEALKTAAEHHAGGDLEYRIPRHSQDELGTLSREINRMADSLIVSRRRLVEQERLAAIGEVASTVAHNIRNPLASIRASAQSSVAEVDGHDELRTRLGSIMETVDSLNQWVKELLLLNQPIQLDLRAVSLREVVGRVVKVLQPVADRRGIRLTAEQTAEHGLAMADAPRLEQAILSVVDNAIEASPEGRAVRIEIADGDGTGVVEVRVVDQGPGIPPEVMESLGRALVSTKPGGTGFGLHLTRRTVQAHGGTLVFESNVGSGTRVTLRLPARDTRAQPAPETQGGA
jgi:signal transduction histidine kinase